MLTCAIISLGCPKNLVDSEQMLGLLQKHAFQPSYEVENADVVIINTCGFLAASRDEGMQNIREMEELRRSPKFPLRCLIVAGCLVTRDRENLVKSCTDVDAFLDVFSRDSILDAVKHAFPEEILPENSKEYSKDVAKDVAKENAKDVGRKNGRENGKHKELAGNAGGKFSLPIYEKPAPIKETFYEQHLGIARDEFRFPLLPPHIAYLKIAEGCNRRCAFCAIPNIRGKYTSKPMLEIVEEAKKLAVSGVKEVILIAQDTSYYGLDLRKEDGTHTDDNLANLLRLLNTVDGIQWIRVLYLYPQNFGADLIAAFAETPKVVPYIDIPLQHINDRLLKAMRRAADREATVELLAKLRESIPQLVIRTSFIAGFPGETKAEFEELLAFLRKQKFEHVAVFQFSPEEGTPAAEMEKQIPQKVSLKRTNELISIQKTVSGEWTQKQVGRTLDVLIDMVSEEAGTYIGHTKFGAPDVDGSVFVSIADEEKPLEIGEIYKCEIVDCDEYDLYAVPVK